MKNVLYSLAWSLQPSCRSDSFSFLSGLTCWNVTSSKSTPWYQRKVSSASLISSTCSLPSWPSSPLLTKHLFPCLSISSLALWEDCKLAEGRSVVCFLPTSLPNPHFLLSLFPSWRVHWSILSIQHSVGCSWYSVNILWIGLSPSLHTIPCVEICPHLPIPNHGWLLELAELFFHSSVFIMAC